MQVAFGLLMGARDRGQHRGLMGLEGAKDRVGGEEEYACVPQVHPAREQALRRRRIGLLDKALERLRHRRAPVPRCRAQG